MVVSDEQPGEGAGSGNGLRVVYFGMTGAFSLPPLQVLLGSGHHVCAVVVPAAASIPGKDRPDIVELKPPAFSSLPIINPHLSQSIVQRAWELNIPVFEAARLGSPETSAAIAAYQPDVGCVACFSRRLPPRLLALPRHGFLNVHPSLLPDYRGPAPIFWTLHDGAPTGVTVHVMDADWDTGDIVAQAPVSLPDGADDQGADRILAARGGELLVDLLVRLQRGSFLRRPQPKAGRWAPWPTAADFELSTTWSSRRAYNFMRVAAVWNQPYGIEVGNERLLLGAARGFTADEELGAPFVREDNRVRIQLTPGVLDATSA